VLAGQPPRGARRRPAWVTRLLFSAGRGHESPVRRLVALECRRDDATLVLRDVADAWGPIRESRFPATEITALRLRASGRDGGGLRVELALLLARKDEPVVKASFRVAALDRDDELVELALAIARCLRLRGYRIRSTRPADVELSPSAADASGDPYRSADCLLAVPAAGQPVDFRAAGTLEFEEPHPDPGSFDPHQVADYEMGDWRVDTWKPGDQVTLRAPGRSPAGAVVMTALVWLPLALVAFPLIAGLIWGAVVLAGVLLVSFGLLAYVFVYCAANGDIPDGTAGADVVGTLYTACMFLGLLGAIPAALWVGRWLIDRHRGSLRRSRALDWTAHELREVHGNQLRDTVPFEDVLAVVAQTGRYATDVVLQRTGGDDLVLGRFWIDRSRDRLAASLATDLARALRVPVHLRTTDPPATPSEARE